MEVDVLHNIGQKLMGVLMLNMIAKQLKLQETVWSVMRLVSRRGVDMYRVMTK